MPLRPLAVAQGTKSCEKQVSPFALRKERLTILSQGWPRWFTADEVNLFDLYVETSPPIFTILSQSERRL